MRSIVAGRESDRAINPHITMVCLQDAFGMKADRATDLAKALTETNKAVAEHGEQLRRRWRG